MNNELYHFGILGMKWGVRRYQNPDGTLTDEGKKRYDITKEGRLSFSGKIKANRDIRALNKATKDYSKSYTDNRKSTRVYINKDTGNRVVVNDHKKEERVQKAFDKMQSLMSITMSKLKESDYTVGYDFVHDKYYLREVPYMDGIDHWSFNKINI